MVGKDHKELLRDIRRYVTQFNERKIALVDFFEESSYVDLAQRVGDSHTLELLKCFLCQT